MKIKFENKELFDFLKNLPNSLSIYKNFEFKEKNLYSINLVVQNIENQIVLEEWITKNITTRKLKPFNIINIGDASVKFLYSPNSEFGEKLHKPGRFLDDYVFDTDPDPNFKEKEENKMSNNLDFLGITKQDFKDGLWRNGANEMVKIVKTAILQACKVQKMNRVMISTIEKTLSWDVTTGAIHSALGYALTYVPMLSSHQHAQRMAKELRVEGMKYFQAEIIAVVKDLIPDLLKILSSVSPEEEQSRIEVKENVEQKRVVATDVPELKEHQATMEVLLAEKETKQVKNATVSLN